MAQSKKYRRMRVAAGSAASLLLATTAVATMTGNASASGWTSESAESYAWLIPASVGALPVARVSDHSGTERIRALQQRLIWTGYPWLWKSGHLDSGTKLAVKMFQAKYLMKPNGIPNVATVKKLREVAGDGHLDKRCNTKSIVLCVSKTQRVTRYVLNGKVLKTLNTNFGPEKGNPKFGLYSATREGSFRIFSKELHPISVLYNTVMPFYMAFDGGIGFHYSGYFAKTGYFDTSQGCTVIDDLPGMKWIYDHSPKGTKVVVYK